MGGARGWLGGDVVGRALEENNSLGVQLRELIFLVQWAVTSLVTFWIFVIL